jgi:methionyl-tRNA synthetase
MSSYEGLYCEGCEAFYEESELVEGRCPFHPTKEIQHVADENYFFRLSKYQDFILGHIEAHPEFIWPERHRNEIVSFVKRGLQDFSVSRKKSKVSWGIPVPDDPEHTIYVWFDALINYLTFGLERDCWPATVHILGKDNQRFHAIYWPAMLKSAGYELPRTILVHDFYSLDGRRISKSLGNGVAPSVMVKEYNSVDAVRYFFLRHGPLVNDVDITAEKLRESYQADLANGLGNLISRVAKLAEKIGFESQAAAAEFYGSLENFLDNYRVDLALEHIWAKIKELDSLIDKNEPWKLSEPDLHGFLDRIVPEIQYLAYNLKPFLPETADKIEKQFTGKVKSGQPLFPRR